MSGHAQGMTWSAFAFVCKDELRLSLCDDPRSESVPPRRTTPPLGVIHARIPNWQTSTAFASCSWPETRQERRRNARDEGETWSYRNSEPARGVLFRDPTPCASGGDPAISGRVDKGKRHFSGGSTGHSFKGGAIRGAEEGCRVGAAGPRCAELYPEGRFRVGKWGSRWRCLELEGEYMTTGLPTWAACASRTFDQLTFS